MRIRIMVFGSFDALHKGHENFFSQAKALAENSFLVVSIARDRNIERIKGRKPDYSEKQRKKDLEKLSIVDKVVLGGLKEYLPHILKEKPDIIALGYDQKAYTETLEQDLEQAGLKVRIVKLKPFKPHIYKSSKIKARLMRKKS